MRLDQGHASDIAMFPTAQTFDLVEEIIPPERLFSRFRFGNIERQRMLQLARVDAKNYAANVKE